MDLRYVHNGRGQRPSTEQHAFHHNPARPGLNQSDDEIDITLNTRGNNQRNQQHYQPSKQPQQQQQDPAKKTSQGGNKFTQRVQTQPQPNKVGNSQQQQQHKQQQQQQQQQQQDYKRSETQQTKPQVQMNNNPRTSRVNGPLGKSKKPRPNRRRQANEDSDSEEGFIEYDEDLSEENDNPKRGHERRANRMVQANCESSDQEDNQRQRQTRSDQSGGGGSGGGNRSQKKAINRKSSQDDNGHKIGKRVDAQYDRSKVEHFFNEKDTKFGKEKRYNFYQQEADHIEKFQQSPSEPLLEEFSIKDLLISLDLTHITEEVLTDPTSVGKIEWSEIYIIFKAMEKKTSQNFTRKPAAGRTAVMVFDKSEMESEEFKFFQSIARLLVLQNLEKASEKKLDQRLWDIYKKQIEFSKSMRLFTSNPDEQLHIFDSKILFLRNLLKEVIETQKSSLMEELVEKNKKRRIIANLCCYFGELIELKEKVNRQSSNVVNHKNMQFAAGQYLKSISIFPYCGKFFYLLATLSHMNEDQFCAIYWCIRATSSTQSYPCKESLQEFLEINRQKCRQFTQEHNSYGQIASCDYLKVFILHFFSYLNIVHTKIGIESIDQHTEMFDYLRRHIAHVLSIQSQSTSNLKDEVSLLGYIVVCIVYTLAKLADYIPGELSVTVIKADPLVSNCLNFSFALLSLILDLFVQSDLPAFVDLVLPIVMFLSVNPVLSEYFFTKYNAFSGLFNKVLQKSRVRFTPFASLMSRANYEKLCDSYLTDLDIQLVGFSPLQQYFTNNKDYYNIIVDDTLHYPIKLFTLLDKMPMIAGLTIQIEDGSVEIEQKQRVIPHHDDFFFLKNVQKYQTNERKQLIVIDGMNVAIRHGTSGFSSVGLRIAVDYWLSHQTEVHVFLPDFCFSTEQIEKKRKKFLKEKQQDRLKTLPDSVEILLQLREEGYATGIPNWNYDDSYMIDFARKKDAFVLTNDRYNDHIQKFRNDPKTMEIVKQWIRNNCMSFTFVKDELQPDPDFLASRTTVRKHDQ